MSNHLAREQTELKNFIFKMLWRYPSKQTFKIIHHRYKKSDELNFDIGDVVQFLKIGLILFKNKMKNKNTEINKEFIVENNLYLIIKSPSGGAWVTARETPNIGLNKDMTLR